MFARKTDTEIEATGSSNPESVRKTGIRCILMDAVLSSCLKATPVPPKGWSVLYLRHRPGTSAPPRHVLPSHTSASSNNQSRRGLCKLPND